jgi:hypothetical protein
MLTNSIILNVAADVSNPESYEDLVELLVPVLQKRGLMWEDYTVPGGTYRENLLATPGEPFTPEGHPSRQSRYERLKERYGVDANGDVTIEKQGPEPLKEVENVARESGQIVVPVVEKSIVYEAPNEVSATA